jgi:hypothetical protein
MVGSIKLGRYLSVGALSAETRSAKFSRPLGFRQIRVTSELYIVSGIAEHRPSNMRRAR